MGRENFFVMSDISSKVEAIIEKERARGATRAEINKTSLYNEIMRLGIMVYERQNDDQADSFNLHDYRKEILTKSVSTGILAETILTILMDMQARATGHSISEDELGDNIIKTIELIKEQTDLKVAEYFPVLEEE